MEREHACTFFLLALMLLFCITYSSVLLRIAPLRSAPLHNQSASIARVVSIRTDQSASASASVVRASKTVS